MDLFRLGSKYQTHHNIKKILMLFIFLRVKFKRFSKRDQQYNKK